MSAGASAPLLVLQPAQGLCSTVPKPPSLDMDMNLELFDSVIDIKHEEDNLPTLQTQMTY